MKKIYFIPLLLLLFNSCSKSGDSSSTPNTAEPTTPVDSSTNPSIAKPVSTWKEHWFEHNQDLKLVYYDTTINVYYDSQMDTTSKTKWAYLFAGDVWNYIKKNYRTSFGPDTTGRLNVILHAYKYGGGHPGYYYSNDHDYRNVIDIGEENENPWMDKSQWEYEILIHEQGHIVESCMHNHFGSVAISLWHDSKWMEIFMYDILSNLGYTSKAQSLYNRMQTTTDDFPKANTQWFKNWFYPIWNNYGKTEVLAKFWELVAKYYDATEITTGKYKGYFNYNSRGEIRHGFQYYMNLGEFVHFWSAAAGSDLKSLALDAFGKYDEDGGDWQAQLSIAKAKYNQLSY